MRRLLLVRPEPGASATASKARAMGIDAVAMPLFEVRAVAWYAPDPTAFDMLLLTSANALRHGGPELGRLRLLPVAAVGEATAAAARELGFRVEQVGHGGVAELLETLPPTLRLLHLAGHDRSEIADAVHRIDVVNVYEAASIDPSDDLGVLAAGTVVALHSPRAASRLAALTANAGIDRSTIALVVFSPAVAAAVGAGWQRIAVADRPSDSALLALAAELCL